MFAKRVVSAPVEVENPMVQPLASPLIYAPPAVLNGEKL